MINIEFNGKKLSFDAPVSVADLLNEQKVNQGKIAVIRNEEVLARSHWQLTQCLDGDKFVAFTMVAGG